MPTWIVTAAYGISFAYVIGDVGNESRNAHLDGASSEKVARVAVKRTVFQGRFIQ